MNRPARSSSGFTLIEIMMVVAILGLALTLGMPSFIKAIKREGMRKAQMDLLEACKDARSSAIMTSQPQYLTMHPIDGTFEAPGFHGQFPRDIVIDILGVNFIQYERSDLARVRFNPNGTSDEFTIVIHDSTGSAMELSLEPITALAKFKYLR